MIFTAPFWHKEYPKTNSKVDQYKSTLTASIYEIDAQIAQNRTDFEQDLINKSVYFNTLDQLTSKRQQLQESNAILLKDFVDQNRVFGWKTTRAFLVGFGVRLPYLILAFIISFLVYKLRSLDSYTKESQLFRRSLHFMQVAVYGICIYFMFWVFWTNQDFSVKAYRWFFVIFSILAAIPVSYFIGYRKLFKLKIHVALDAISRFMVIDAKKYVDQDKKTEYIQGYRNALEEGMKKL